MTSRPSVTPTGHGGRAIAPLALVALIVGTAMFGLAIAYRGNANPWWTNGAAAGVAIVLSLLAMRRRIASLFVGTTRSIVGAVLLGIGLVAATHASFWLACQLFPALPSHIAPLYQNVDAARPPLVLTVALLLTVVFAEELLWRGVAFEVLEARCSPVVVVTGSTILYVAPQLIGGSWVLIVAAGLLGGGLAIQRWKTGRIIEPLITHAIWSAAIFVALPLI